MTYPFQSRNRESYLFKEVRVPRSRRKRRWRGIWTFQSRNRESYLFKVNLVVKGIGIRKSRFQSRNRESYLFKKPQIGVQYFVGFEVSIS